MKTATHPNRLSNSSPIDSGGHQAIRQRAEEIYVRNGRIPGRDMENWIQAETEILREAAGHWHRTAIAVKVSGVYYVGEYSDETADGYTPGEFSAGDSVTVSFDGDKMFVRRNSGGELETTIIKRIG